jgi:hypothetical protein
MGEAEALIDSLTATLPATVRHFYYDESHNDFTLCDRAKQPPHYKARYGKAGLETMLRAWNDARAGCSLPVLLLFSDFQKPTTDLLDSLLRIAAPKAPVICVNLAPRDPWNYSLRNVMFHEAENRSSISAVVVAQGRRLDSGEVSVVLSTISAGVKRLSVRANDSGEISIAVASGAGPQSGSVTLAAKDPLPFDNTAFFAARAPKALRVIVVGDKEKSFPIAAAFSAAGKDRFDPVVARTPEEVSFDDLDSAAVVVVNDIAGFSRQLDAFLSGRSSIGKVLIFAPNTGDEGFGRSSMFIAGLSRLKNPLTLAVRSTPSTVMLPDTISEVWRGFPALATREAAVYRYAEGLPGDALLRLDNGAPLLTRFTDAEGRTWLLAATPLGVTAANNLCETGFYVPAIDRMVRHAAGSISPVAETWVAGIKRRNRFYAGGKSATIVNSEGVVIDRWQSQPEVVFRQPGVYTVVPTGEAPFAITVIADPEESKLEYRVPDVPGPLKGMVKVLTGLQFMEVLKGQKSPLSWVPWVLLALALLVEVLLWPSSKDGLKPAPKT